MPAGKGVTEIRRLKQLEEENRKPEGLVPFAANVGCTDSRTSDELIFDQRMPEIYLGASICESGARTFPVGLIRDPSAAQHGQHHIGRHGRDQVLEGVSADGGAEKSVNLTVEMLADLR